MRLTLIFILFSFGCYSQNTSIDVLHYDLDIHVFDSTDQIEVSEKITFVITEFTDDIYFDLVNQFDELNDYDAGKGMQVHQATCNSQEVDITHQAHMLFFSADPYSVGDTLELFLNFSGVPQNGLIIGENKFKERTFFADNWPNRAKHWMACNDHPSDKATTSIRVTAPDHYECVATGVNSSVKSTKSHQTVHEFHSDIELPTKVIVIGLADFAIETIPHKYDFELSSWVYQKDEKKGFQDLKVAKEVVDFFIQFVGDYPFEKLANVQSTTMFGGMENAGNIFYDENAVTGKGTMEALIAHEIAHQWFGNSASESDWQHLWLSEGFATYLTDLYWLEKHGNVEFQQRLMNERNRIIGFSKKYNHPVVDTTFNELFDLLNPNSYQKGAWFLHMLREKAGADDFQQILQTYYSRFKYSNASTTDFRRVVEEVTNENYDSFFNQWLTQYGHPILKMDVNTHNQMVIEQMQENLFEFPIEIEYIFEDGSTEIIEHQVAERISSFDLKFKKKLVGSRTDPNIKLLVELVEH